MKTVIEKTRLIDTLKKNREDHRKLYEEALVGYHNAVTKALEEVAKKFAETKTLDISPIYEAKQPENHDRDYAEALEMLEYTTEDVISLEHKEFRTLVLDKWDWMGRFAASSGMYLSDESNSVINSKLL